MFLIIAAHKDVDLHTGYIADLYFKVISFPVMVVNANYLYKLRNILFSEKRLEGILLEG